MLHYFLLLYLFLSTKDQQESGSTNNSIIELTRHSVELFLKINLKP